MSYPPDPIEIRGSVPADSSRSREEDALDRLAASLDTLDYYCSHPTGTTAADCRVCIVTTEGKEALATVRGEIERLTEERDRLDKMSSEYSTLLRDAEAEVSGLRFALLDWLDKPHRDDLYAALEAFLPEHFQGIGNPVSRLTGLLEHTTEGLREIIGAWEALGRCEEEFGHESAYCGAYEEALDTAIDEARALLAAPEAQPEGEQG